MISIDENIKLFGTEGSGHQKKAWINIDEQKYLIKLNSKYREALKEQDASIILRSCGINAVEYKAIKVNVYGVERNACICKSFLCGSDFTITLGKILEDVTITLKDSAMSYMNKSIEKVVMELGIPEEIVYKYLITIVTADYLLMNPDRHLSNIEFVNHNGVWGVAPLFDFGQSFLHKDGISSMKQFTIEERSFKTLPFSRNPEKNLVNIEHSKQLARMMLNTLDSIGGIDNININTYHKLVFKNRMNKLLNL